MAYTPTTWTTGDTITATAMNKIENGIANAGGGGLIDGIVFRLSNNDYSILGDFNSALAKAQEGLPVIVYEANMDYGSGWYQSYITLGSFLCYYSESYPNRIDIRITGGVGFYWTESGIEYYD